MDDGLTPTGRLFAAVVPPGEVVAALEGGLGRLEVPGRVVPPPNWHITLRFAGHLEMVTYERWLAGLSELRPDAVKIRLLGLGAFPGPRRANVLWAGVDAPRLDEWAVAIEEACQSAGMDPEERPFRPHLTLSRLRPPVDVRALIDGFEPLRAVEWTARQFHLMAAVGSRYHIYATFP